MKISFFLKNYQYRAKIYTSWICMWFLPGSPKQLTCWPVFQLTNWPPRTWFSSLPGVGSKERQITICFADLAHRIAPGQWTVKFGRDVKGLPHQTTGNDCGVFILMYALNFSTDAPLWFTERDIAQIRKWWCIMLMERYQIEGHGQRFSYWTNEAEELLKGALEPVYRVSKKQKTEHEVNRHTPVCDKEMSSFKSPTCASYWSCQTVFSRTF
ncbi:uncharacterized protein LOC117553834 isoform X2 [Gymnodraco acuticeps]|uniref:Uncharacterized protein LOC117553834 isoform X2 n=1 Tax=Gymnodraco acuticeps TaxID=8218 RepID=A0A6P8VAK9_GYMAC|nr:uncharacterized protein LOC117553834 isoform X2 [Gymnodraco acuticeps]